MPRGKECVKKFRENIADEVIRLNTTFPQQPMTDLTDALKRKHEAAEKCHILLKEFDNPENRNVRDNCYSTSLNRGASQKPLQPKIPSFISHPHCV